MTVVVDSSALLHAVLGTSQATAALRRRLMMEVCHAPHLIDAETGSTLRRRVLRGEMPVAAAATLLGAGSALIDHRYAMTGPLALAAWALGENVSFYDGLYAALADALGCVLVTADDRLRRAPGLPCTVEFVGSR